MSDKNATPNSLPKIPCQFSQTLFFSALVCSVAEEIEGAEMVPKKRRVKKKTEEGSESRDRLDSDKSLVIGLFLFFIGPVIYLWTFFFLLNCYYLHLHKKVQKRVQKRKNNNNKS